MFDLRLDGEAAFLTLNRPEARNAIPAHRWPDIARAGDEAVRSGARILVLRGAGSAFCAGADISDFSAMRASPEAGAAFRQSMREGIEGLAGLPVPTVAAVDGPCFGAGVALAMACDLRIASPGSSFAITPAKFGISYPQEDVQRLVSLIGPGQASRLLLSALPISAAEAARIGLVEIVADPLEAELEAVAAAILAGSGESHETLKQAIRLAARGVASDERQDRRFDAMISSDALHERLRTLRSKG
jgi:enoyl-CoA hydratase/carnithine racemase